MAKLLGTRLPIANGLVTPDLFNRLVRLLELNLGEFDPINTEQFTTTERDQSNFNAGTIIFNTTLFIFIINFITNICKIFNIMYI